MSRLGLVWYGWLGGIWHGRLLYGLFRLGRRVMVSLGAVLCGSVMYGLVRLARLGQVAQGVAWNGLVLLAW